MNKQSNTYTIIYIIVLVVLVGTALAATSLALKGRQQENIDADKMKQILAAALITPADGETVAEFNRYITDQYVVNAQGERIEGVKAFDVNVANQSKLTADRRELPVFVCMVKENDPKYILPVYGAGLWGPIWGYVAFDADGCIALLDQLSVLNSTDSAIDVEDINRLLGRLSFNSLSNLFSAVATSNQNQALEVLNEIYNQGNEPIQILSNFLEFLRNSLIIKSVGTSSVQGVVQLNDEQIAALNEKLSTLETHQLVSLIDKCASYIKELKQTPNPKLWLDVAVLDMSNLVENTKLEDLQKRISMLEDGTVARPVNVSAYNTPPSPVMKQEIRKPAVASIPKPVEPTKPQQQVKSVPTAEEVLNEPVPMSKPAPADANSGLKALWVKLLENISSSPSRSILKQQAIPVKITQDEVILSIKSSNWLKQYAADGSKHAFIVEAANLLFAGGVKKIIVRAPEAGDDAIRAEQSSADDEKPAPAPEPKIQPVKAPEVKPEEVKQLVEAANQDESENAVTSSEPVLKSRNPDHSYHSDIVNSVMELFEGKFID